MSCPYCKSNDITHDEVDIGVGIQYGPGRCENCHAYQSDDWDGLTDEQKLNGGWIQGDLTPEQEPPTASDFGIF